MTIKKNLVTLIPKIEYRITLSLNKVDRNSSPDFHWGFKYSKVETIMNFGSEWRMDPIPQARVERVGRPGLSHQSS